MPAVKELSHFISLEICIKCTKCEKVDCHCRNVHAGLSHIAALQQYEALLASPGIVPKMVTVSLLFITMFHI